MLSRTVYSYILAGISENGKPNLLEFIVTVTSTTTLYLPPDNMRRISRIEQSTNLLRVRASSRTPSPYLCRACKQNSASFSTTGLQAAANSPGFTEKIRRKIWGTDSPPGAEDPYGGLSRFDRTKQKELEQEQEQEQGQQLEQTASDPAELPADYQPSDTWHGLDIVGDEVAMFKRRWRSEHKFEGFVPNYVMRNTAEITANLRRAIIEVLAQRQVGKTTALSTIASGDDLTHTVKLGYAESGLSLDFGSQERFEYIVQSLAPVQETIEQEEPTLAEEGVAAEPTTEDPLETASTGSETAASAEDVQDESTWKGLTQTSAQSYDEMVAGWDSSWLQIPLDNPEVKFAVGFPCYHFNIC